jgi:hypothetical protein
VASLAEAEGLAAHAASVLYREQAPGPEQAPPAGPERAPSAGVQ